MKIKTSEIQGAALDWAVAQCEGISSEDYYETFNEPYTPSIDWAQGGPIIEREVIVLIHPKHDCWTAHVYDKHRDDESYTLDGTTPLIAAMRCYVASKLGDEVDVPDL
jgi:hypothetical protein